MSNVTLVCPQNKVLTHCCIVCLHLGKNCMTSLKKQTNKKSKHGFLSPFNTKLACTNVALLLNVFASNDTNADVQYCQVYAKDLFCKSALLKLLIYFRWCFLVSEHPDSFNGNIAFRWLWNVSKWITGEKKIEVNQKFRENNFKAPLSFTVADSNCLKDRGKKVKRPPIAWNASPCLH